MPARIVDGDALWRSDKLTQVNPSSYRAEYANMIPLALADGTFECNPRRVWADVYSYNRPDITVDMVEDILNEFERVGLLSRKSDEKGKIWGFWIGIEKRLPSESTRDRYRQGNSNVFSDFPVATIISRPNHDDIVPRLDLDKSKIGKEGSVATDPAELYGQCKRIYRRYVGKSLGSLGPRASQWQELVNQHGELILSAMDIWAQEGGKGFRNLRWPLAVFMKNADEFIDAAKQVTVEQQQESKQEDVLALAVQAGQTAHAQEEQELMRRRAEQEEENRRIAADPDALFKG
jgi:hypothetical protein